MSVVQPQASGENSFPAVTPALPYLKDSSHRNSYVPPVDSRFETHDQNSDTGIFLALAGKRRVANIYPVLIFLTDTRNSPGLTINLSSNNPFRNRAASPAQPSPQSPRFDVNSSSNANNQRPVSRNPFLDVTDNDDRNPLSSTRSPVHNMSVPNGASSPPKSAIAAHAKELFDNLALDDNPASSGIQHPMQPPPPYSTSAGPALRPENGWQGVNGKRGPPVHRPTRSQEEEQRPRPGVKPRGPPRELDIFADPAETVRHRENRRPTRRNSESSVADRAAKQLDPEEEKRRRERRHREREAGARDGKGKGYTSSKPKKPNQRLDVIDKLDVTSIYGMGLFHHDGPFDACNPHRNRTGSQRAPMQAFPRDSANNALGGSGPVNKQLDINQFHGRGAEGFTDFSTSGFASDSTQEPFSVGGRGQRPAVDNGSIINPTARVEPVHGDESMGLGTSTFLEGAPASRTAIKRRESESENGTFGTIGGLARKASLAQRIRGISNNRTNIGPSGRMTSPDPVYQRTIPPISPGQINTGENNPFFNSYNDAYEKKGARIQIAEEARGDGMAGRARAPSSPMRSAARGAALERRITNDGTTSGEGEGKTGGGFLSRVKSLKGGRRNRPERA